MFKQRMRQAAEVRVRLCWRHTGRDEEDVEAAKDEEDGGGAEAADADEADEAEEESCAERDEDAVLRLDGGRSRCGMGTVRRVGSDATKWAAATSVTVATELAGRTVDGV